LTPLNKLFYHFNEAQQIRRRVVSGDTTGFMSEQVLTIFEGHILEEGCSTGRVIRTTLDEQAGTTGKYSGPWLVNTGNPVVASRMRDRAIVPG
jgi:hypothetical protein